MGMREYSYEGGREDGQLKPVPDSALGMLRDENLSIMTREGQPVTLTPEIRSFLFSKDPIIITKANLRARVHRRTHLDYIGIKQYTPAGDLAGELRVVGLFTSTAYNKSVMRIPRLRAKVEKLLTAKRLDPSSHSGKALINVLETWPRDDLFQIEEQLLAGFCDKAIRLDERPRVRVLPRLDKFNRYVSVLVYVPRERYDTNLRVAAGELLANAYDGYVSMFSPNFMENGLTRVQFIIGRAQGEIPEVRTSDLESQIEALTRTWGDDLALENASDVSADQFSSAYQQKFSTARAITDAGLIQSLDETVDIAVDFLHDHENANRAELRFFHKSAPVPLSQRVPMLENMGFSVIEEFTFELTNRAGETVFLHVMSLAVANGEEVSKDLFEGHLEDALHAIWSKKTDDDPFNALVLTPGLDWKLITVFRAYARYLRQIQSRFPMSVMAKTLTTYPHITETLARLFTARFNPDGNKNRRKQTVDKAVAAITSALDDVSSSDDDAIIRNFLNLSSATLRTNYFALDQETASAQRDQTGGQAPAPVLAIKFDPAKVRHMPQPVPYREIFVSSPQVEGLHLRFGPVARGGLRWSDRAQDYRTEVLGLVKAQQVKNAVIVPVGSKGGFYPKNLPPRDDYQAWFEEGKTAYKTFITSLLSVTDNIIEGEVAAPAKTIRRDGDDPYFVVAADKGTATFSDTANGISQARDFWLDDAFASGGSAGYDHKAMGITARGAWEAVKRHFREMDRDIQSQPFTTVGVGDMSGDVFGNGMLLSKQTRLIAAFDHRDIFIDPDPDAAKSFKERQRLFKLGRSSWQDYKTDLISKGGGVFKRASKEINLSKEAAEALGAQPGKMSPQDLLTIILKAPVDLMWFGGIGTYVRASHESNAEADDRANDPIRVTATELRVKVIGEGANLGVTHPARIEFSSLGGACNSDAIDNSAGVNSSDVEVNIKIALSAAMKNAGLTREKRNTLLESMTDDVADLVLANNYKQTLAISLAQRTGLAELPHQQRMMQSLEDRGRLDRAVEDLPDDAMIAERMARGEPLTRPEIGVLLAYAKIVALDDLVESDLPDDPYLERDLFSYFPPAMHETYAKQIKSHQLRREIIGTLIANAMINRGGPTFLQKCESETGQKTPDVAKGFIAARTAFDLQSLIQDVDALDTKITGKLQLQLYAILQDRVVSQSIWFTRHADFSDGLEPVANRYRKAIETLAPKLDKLVPGFLVERMANDEAGYKDQGVPAKTAKALAQLPIAGLLPDVQLISETTNKGLTETAQAFFAVTEEFHIGRIVQAARGVEPTDYYDGLALNRALQSLHAARRDITHQAMETKGGFKGWLEQRHEPVNRTKNQMTGIIDQDNVSVSRLTVAANILADLAR
ncbi:MAG: NAD-glutamate dehydrogenase [Pseudomonadota bacterium]